jgi:hypothetical protein
MWMMEYNWGWCISLPAALVMQQSFKDSQPGDAGRRQRHVCLSFSNVTRCELACSFMLLLLLPPDTHVALLLLLLLLLMLCY